jgi:hypothetical protein
MAEAQAPDGNVDQVAAETLSERSGTEKGAVVSVRPTRLAMRSRPIGHRPNSTLLPHTTS